MGFYSPKGHLKHNFLQQYSWHASLQPLSQKPQSQEHTSIALLSWEFLELGEDSSPVHLMQLPPATNPTGSMWAEPGVGYPS